MALRQAGITPADWRRCKEVFGEVLRLSEEARESRINAACGTDEDLSRAVRGLLAVHARSGGFLDPPILARSFHAELFVRSEATAPDEAGWQERVIGGRYRLRSRIGSGAAGLVYRADDLLTGGTVACKLLRREPGPGFPDGLRSETAALRLLRIPGVVRMIEDGAEDGVPYLVMDLVAGTPFPGTARPAPWKRIAETAIALLETLDRIHQAGFVHRDLKPGNVLVDADGRPTVLDLGIALHPRRARGLDEAVAGTPNYLSPEQLLGEPATPASDLYSAGVMLFEALSGALPHRAGARHALKGEAPACPAEVSELLARLLKADPADRPRTAAEALALVQRASRPEERIPWLGGDDIVRAIVAAALRGESLDVAGPRGSGRTRALTEAAARLEREGRTILRFRPGEGFAGLLDAAETAALGRLDAAKDLARTRLAEALSKGAVAIADDWPRLEAWVAEVVAAGRAHGTVIRGLDGAAEGAVALRPLSRPDLLDLFHGPDRVFHLREDAAEALFARTRGHPAAVADEALAWVRLGYARWERGRLAVTREALDRLLGGGVEELPRPGRLDPRLLPPHIRSLAAVVQVAGRHATPERIAPILRRPAWQVDAQLQELRALGVVSYEEGSPAVPSCSIDLLSALGQEELRTAHARLAEVLPPGDEDRLRHLVSARELDGVHEEVRAVARRLAASGRPGRAIPILEEALGTLRESPAHPALVPILEDLVLVGLRAWSAAPLHRALYELEMSPEQGPRVRKLADLARAGLVLIQGVWERSLFALERLEPFADARLEHARQMLRVLAASRGGLARERATILDVSAWATGCGLPEARRSLVMWLAWLRYNEGRFEDAARLHGQAAELAEDPASRAAALASRATALMDDMRLDEAREAVQAALRTIAAFRDPVQEARLLITQRSIEYRLGAAQGIDLELPEIVGRTGVRYLEAVAVLTEAAVAWRMDHLDAAQQLAARSARLWEELGHAPWACLPQALRLASLAAANEAEVMDVASRAAQCPQPGIAVQSLGLLALARPDLSPALRIPDAWLQALPRRTWPVRREVLSVEEALYGRIKKE